MALSHDGQATTPARITIFSDGYVEKSFYLGGTGWLSLDGLSYPGSRLATRLHFAASAALQRPPRGGGPDPPGRRRSSLAGLAATPRELDPPEAPRAEVGGRR